MSLNLRSEPPTMLVTYADLAGLGIHLSRKWVNNLSKQGAFPKPFRLTPRRLVWRRSDILAWIDEQEAFHRRHPPIVADPHASPEPPKIVACQDKVIRLVHRKRKGERLDDETLNRGKMISDDASEGSPRTCFDRPARLTRPVGTVDAELMITQVRHNNRCYEVLPGAPPDYTDIAVRIFQARADGNLDIELNGHLVTLPRAVFEEGPQHPHFRREAEKVGLRMLPLQYRYWFSLVFGLKDDMERRFGAHWYSTCGDHAPLDDRWWAQVEARENQLDRQIMEGRVPPELWTEIVHRLGTDPRPYRMVASIMKLAMAGRLPLFDASDAGRPR